ncbi:hypothetical protein [Immundisolibacter sp.]|uniref:hypothetical protein n=1 Tax=Immundisolibacter sp. TaxID=1934948 RepID=UPI002636C241|nr:hypothetical protein [Immundisolibacter sp.]MDD3652440.1 hypothetical protein [Immundisolibacter sp.]
MADKARCAVRGAILPGRMCSHVMVGGVFCCFEGKCKHKRISFRPSNGTIGDSFIADWCGRCARDKALREGVDIEECDDNEVCDIVSRTMAYRTDEPEYPSEWICDQDGRGACCTAFIPAGDPVPPPRCERTGDMFGGA